MQQLLGAALVAGACAWTGFRQADMLRRQVRAMEDLENGLSLLEQRLQLGGPLPRLLQEVGERSAGPAQSLFCFCGKELENEDCMPFAVLWRQGVERLNGLEPEGKDCLLPLGEALGQCALDDQRKAVSVSLRRFERLIHLAREECRSQGKLYRVLGLSGGAFLTILLL